MLTALLSIFFLGFSYIALGFLCIQLALQQPGKFLRLARLALRSDFKGKSDEQVVGMWQNSSTRVQNDIIYAMKSSVAWPTWFMLVLAASDKKADEAMSKKSKDEAGAQPKQDKARAKTEVKSAKN